MKRIVVYSILGTILTGLAACSTHRLIEPETDLAAKLDAVLAAPVLRQTFVGAHVVDLQSGEAVYSRNADRCFMPASNQKLLTTAATLCLLGEDYNFHTDFILHGEQRDSTFIGNIILHGRGDPAWCEHYQAVDTLFAALADSLKNRSIYQIKGKIGLDESFFDDERLGLGWSWENIPYAFSAPISPLSIFENSITFRIKAGDMTGDSACVQTADSLLPISIENEILTDIFASQPNIQLEQKQRDHYKFSGILPPDTTIDIRAGVSNPARMFGEAIRQKLPTFGIGVDAAIYNIDELENFSYNTDTVRITNRIRMADILTAVNRQSRNLDAELLFRTLGAERHGLGSRQNAAAVLRTWMAAQDMDTTALQIADGSGLSRKNLITPKSLVRLLQFMQTQDNAALYLKTLPLAGQEGTLKGRMPFLSPNDQVRAKTGTLDAVSALSGYVLKADEPRLAFSLIMNHYVGPAAPVRNVQDTFCSILLQLLEEYKCLSVTN